MAAQAPRFTGLELYEGLFVGRGPVAAHLGVEYPVPANPQVRAAYDQVTEITAQIVAGIRLRDPGFFESFQQRIQSGDPGLFRVALEDATSETQLVLKDIVGVASRPAGATADDLVIIMAPLFVFGIAIAVAAAGSYAIVLTESVGATNSILVDTTQVYGGPSIALALGLVETPVQYPPDMSFTPAQNQVAAEASLSEENFSRDHVIADLADRLKAA